MFLGLPSRRDTPTSSAHNTTRGKVHSVAAARSSQVESKLSPAPRVSKPSADRSRNRADALFGPRSALVGTPLRSRRTLVQCPRAAQRAARCLGLSAARPPPAPRPNGRAKRSRVAWPQSRASRTRTWTWTWQERLKPGFPGTFYTSDHVQPSVEALEVDRPRI